MNFELVRVQRVYHYIREKCGRFVPPKDKRSGRDPFNLGTELLQGYKKLVIETNTSNPA